MTILALEFSSAQRSVAVARGGVVLGEAMETGGRSVTAFAMIENVLAQAKIEREAIEAIAVGLGPGSYTGIRAAIALAQGWQLARAVQTMGLSSVVAMAAQAQAEEIFGRVNIAVDAQRQEFYLATYEINRNECAEVAPLKILPQAEVQSQVKEGDIIIGPDAVKFFKNGRAMFPRAATVAIQAAGRNDFLPGERLEPIYLRETNFVKAKPGWAALNPGG
jgi:tRNA threonylcarbamoyladenosine biosynthesis protein TsaB